MGIHSPFDDRAEAMASPWRRRSMCLLDAGTPARLDAISGGGACVQTDARLPIGALVRLHHPVAGSIAGRVEAVLPGGVSIAFDRSERSVAFALAAITADMSRPAPSPVQSLAHSARE